MDPIPSRRGDDMNQEQVPPPTVAQDGDDRRTMIIHPYWVLVQPAHPLLHRQTCAAVSQAMVRFVLPY